LCNLYSITTNQAAIINLFRVINPYVGNLAPMPGLSGLSRSRHPQHGQRHRTGDDAMGHAATTAHRRPARDNATKTLPVDFPSVLYSRIG
jgi:hypothetical protein